MKIGFLVDMVNEFLKKCWPAYLLRFMKNIFLATDEHRFSAYQRMLIRYVIITYVRLWLFHTFSEIDLLSRESMRIVINVKCVCPLRGLQSAWSYRPENYLRT